MINSGILPGLGQQDWEPLRGKSASERVSERVSERTSENLWKPLKTSDNPRKTSPSPETLSEADFPLRGSRSCCLIVLPLKLSPKDRKTQPPQKTSKIQKIWFWYFRCIFDLLCLWKRFPILWGAKFFSKRRPGNQEVSRDQSRIIRPSLIGPKHNKTSVLGTFVRPKRGASELW